MQNAKSLQLQLNQQQEHPLDQTNNKQIIKFLVTVNSQIQN